MSDYPENDESASPDSDRLHRFSFTDIPVRGQWVRLEQTVTAANAIRSYPQAIKGFLNEMFAAVAMFADNLKFQGAVTLQSKGSGRLIRTLAECREQKFLRGIAHIDEDLAVPEQADNLSAWLQQGHLALSLIPPADSQQTPYQGLVALEHSRLSENLEHYLLSSEQLPSKLYFANTGVRVTGLLLQRLPSSDSATEIELAAEQEAWHTITTLADTVTDEELANLPVEVLLQRLFAEYTCRLHPPRFLSYRCTCSRQKSDQTLRVLGSQEIEDLFQELGEIYVDCEFCGTRYGYDAVDIGALLRGDVGANSPKPIH